MKFPAGVGVGEVGRNQYTVCKCYVEAVKGGNKNMKLTYWNVVKTKAKDQYSMMSMEMRYAALPDYSPSKDS